MKLRMGTLTLSSPAFATGVRIPVRFTGAGDNVSPALEWSGAPKGTRQFAIAVHDPDAPLPRGFTHWLVWGIPGSASGIPEGGGGAFRQGKNGMGTSGYVGPAPPRGHGVHHYFFWVYALDAEPDLRAGAGYEQFLAAIEDHVIEQARIVGVFEQ
ncbi:MAG: YbhB/YbcL family Raf kinase inhibitor-like protein [Betaproteobacteria bacterium]